LEKHTSETNHRSQSINEGKAVTEIKDLYSCCIHLVFHQAKAGGEHMTQLPILQEN